jgi:hypothetical protein
MGSKLKDLYGTPALIGGTGLLMSEQSAVRPDALTMGIGGALSGFGYGGFLGAGIGLLGGLLSGATKRGHADMASRAAYNNMIASKNVEPSYYAEKGGVVMNGGQQTINVQAKKGEVVAMPSGQIMDLLSKKESHKDMKKSEKTDELPMGAFIGDDTEIFEKDADEIKYAGKPAVYSETKEYGQEPTTIRLSRFFNGNKSLKVSEALTNIKKQIKTPQRYQDGIDDPFAIQTAKENLQTRAKYIAGVIDLASKKNKMLKTQLNNI